MKVKWEIDDGYIGNRPHYVDVDDDELTECETEEARNELIGEYVHEEFMNHISYSWSIE